MADDNAPEIRQTVNEALRAAANLRAALKPGVGGVSHLRYRELWDASYEAEQKVNEVLRGLY